MIYTAILISSCLGVVLGTVIGFVFGRYVWHLLSEIDALKALEKEPKPFVEAPTVTMGVLDPPRSIGNTGNNRTAGIVETKTPELLDWEQQEAIKKKVLGQ